MLRSRHRVNLGGRVPPLDDISAAQFCRYFDDKVAGVGSATADASPMDLLLLTYLLTYYYILGASI